MATVMSNRYEKFGPKLIELGYDITPVHGKRPFITGWSKRPESALDFKAHADCNIGVLCGGEENIVAIDVDVTNPFCVMQIQALIEDHLGFAPKRIGKKGFLMPFRCTEPVSKAATSVYEIDGDDCRIEILAEGQQFVASGIHPDTQKPYEWPNDNLTDFSVEDLTVVTPEELEAFRSDCESALAQFGKKKGREAAPVSSPIEYTPSRLNITQPLEGELAEVRLWIDAAENDDIDYDAWVTTLHAIKGATNGSLEGLELAHEYSRKSAKYQRSETDRVWHSIKEVKYAGASQLRALAAGKEIKPDVVPKPPLPIIYSTDIAANVDTSDFVEDLLTEGALSVCYGASNSGKTFFATDLALHVALGWRYRGRFDVEQGGVLYCALEGGFGIKNRVAAFKQHHNIQASFDFGIIPTNINIFDPDADSDLLIEAIRSAAAKFEKPVRLIVIDTLARAMAGGNENTAEDMGLLIANADRIREETSAHIMFIHHSGKDASKGARGSSALRAATDTELEVHRNQARNETSVSVTKQRDMEILEDPLGFRLEIVELGENRRGKAVTSCVVSPIDMTVARRQILTAPENEIYQAIVNCMATPGNTVVTSPQADYPALTTLPSDTLQNYLVSNAFLDTNGNGTVTGAARTKKSKVMNALRTKGYIGMTKDYVWLLE